MPKEQRIIVVAGYLVRFPLGGYAWQAAHYLLGLRALGYDVWFYENTGQYSTAYDPVNGVYDATYSYGIATAPDFLTRSGLEVAQEYFAAEKVIGELLRQVGL